MKQLEDAQKAVEKRKKQVIDTYRPIFHPCAPEGWINDPNGFCFFNGKVQLYYQHNPYDSKWDDMHWGHWTSADLAHWQDENVAMAPDMPYDDFGVFSGSALDVNGKMVAMYTGVETIPGSKDCYQQQCIAESYDGNTFIKYKNNPVIGNSDQPEGHSHFDFRDPKIEKTPDGFRAIMASKDDKTGEGQLVTYTTKDLHTWQFEGVYINSEKDMGIMTECPDFYTLDGKRVVTMCLIDSPTKMRTAYFIGSEEGGRFIKETPMAPLDYADDFYAPQSMEMPDGRRIMIGWMSSFTGTYPTHTLHHGWAGMMTIPRVMTIKDGVLCQNPVEELACRRKNEAVFEFDCENEAAVPGCRGKHKEIHMEISNAENAFVTIKLMKTGDEAFVVTYDGKNSTLECDRTSCGYPIYDTTKPVSAFKDESGEDEGEIVPVSPVCSARVEAENGKLDLQIFVDSSVVEIFAQNGKKTISMLSFPKGDEYGVSVQSDKAVEISGKAWDIE